MIRCGSSQLNQKLEKMKSTPDLLGDFRKAVPSGENLRDYFMRQKPKEQPNLEEVIKESMIEASNTEDHQFQEIDDAADVLLRSVTLTNFDEDDREADIIKLRRLEAQLLLNESAKKDDFERIFHDSGIEFAGRANTSGGNFMDNQMIARLVLQSGVTSSCNIPTETNGEETSKHMSPSTSRQHNNRRIIDRNNFMQMLHSKQKKETLLTYDEEAKFGPSHRARLNDIGAKIQTDASKGPQGLDTSNEFWLGRGVPGNFLNQSVSQVSQLSVSRSKVTDEYVQDLLRNNMMMKEEKSRTARKRESKRREISHKAEEALLFPGTEHGKQEQRAGRQ